MSEEPVVTVDARGHRCPTPTLRLRRALEALAAGEAALVLADDPLARIDIPHFAAANGHTVTGMTTASGILRVLITKGL